MSRTFTNLGYTVTVEDDRSILVKPGDWISKYAGAIYGDPKANWNRFMRKQGNSYVALRDPSRIEVGERLYHLAPLPGERRWIRPRPGLGAPQPGTHPPAEPDTGEVRGERVLRFLHYLLQVANPATDWRLVGSSGFDGGISFVNGQYAKITVKQQGGTPLDYHAVGLGLTAGLEDLWCSFSMSPPSFENFASGIGKFVWGGASLGPDEFCGNYATLDFGAGCFLGATLSFLFFGANAPPQAFVRTVGRYLQGGNENVFVLPSLFKGFMVSLGPNAGSPTFGVTLRLGIMHRWECVAGS